MSGGGVIDSAAPPRRRASDTQRLGAAGARARSVGGGGRGVYARTPRQLHAPPQITRVEGHWAVEQFMHYWRLSSAGLWTAGAGLALAVGLALWQRRRNSTTTPRS